MNTKSSKFILRAILAVVAAYLVYIMFTYYTSDNQSGASLSFSTSPSNIVTSVKATYTMKNNEGQLKLETNDKTLNASPNGKISNVFSVDYVGNKVSETNLTISYDDIIANCDENHIRFVKVDEQSNVSNVDFKIDKKRNIIEATITQEGMSCIIKNN